MDSLATVGGVERYVNRGAGGIGRNRSLVERNSSVGIAQQAGRDSAALQFVLQLAGQREHHVFLG